MKKDIEIPIPEQRTEDMKDIDKLSFFDKRKLKKIVKAYDKAIKKLNNHIDTNVKEGEQIESLKKKLAEQVKESREFIEIENDDGSEMTDDEIDKQSLPKLVDMLEQINETLKSIV